MRIKLQDSFIRKLNRQVAYIAWDKPDAARKFKSELLLKIRDIGKQPFKHRKSIYFDDESVRDLIFKGYTVVYKIDSAKREILIFGFVQKQNDLG